MSDHTAISKTDESHDPQAPPPAERATFVGRALGYLPTLVVLAVIGAIAYWGHRTGWSAPKFADLKRTESAAVAEDWCVEHNVPESRCIKCNPGLVGGDVKDWCPEHGVPESKCTLCHPEILTTGVAGDWCPEHGIPETSCTLCHPEIAVKGATPASASGAVVSFEPGSAPSQAPTTRPSAGSVKDPKTCQTHALRVQFASGDAVRKAGVRLGQVVERPMATVLTANAEVQYNRNRVAQISAPSAGRVWRVEKEIGDAVKQGEVIALVESADVGRAKAEYLQASAEQELKTQTLHRLRSSADSGFRTGAELQEAEAAVKAAGIRVFNARQSLVNLGLTAQDADAAQAVDQKNIHFMGLPRSVAEKLNPETTTANLLALTAPFDGTITERSVVAGEVVESSKPLFVIADTRAMWVTADIPLTDVRRVKIGQAVTFRPDGSPDERSIGKITWISTSVDDQTRTVKVRGDVENIDGALLAHTFGKADITIRAAAAATVVPAEAIQWEGCCYVTFVRLTDDIFQTRKVKLGVKANDYQEVVIGLLPGEVVAAGGSHVLKSEILKSALGAGCCVVEEPKS